MTMVWDIGIVGFEDVMLCWIHVKFSVDDDRNGGKHFDSWLRIDFFFLTVV